MVSNWLRTSAAALLTASLTLAQFPPTPEGTTIKHFDNYSISYKATTICETTAKAWSGYVHLPGSYIGDFVPQNETVSLFFWYFEARHAPQDDLLRSTSQEDQDKRQCSALHQMTVPAT